MRLDRPAVEVFTDGCPICQETVDQVRAVLGHAVTLEVYDLRAGWNRTDWLAKASRYGVTRVPAIVVNGKLLDWCRRQPIPEAQLKSAGLRVAGPPNEAGFPSGPFVG